MDVSKLLDKAQVAADRSSYDYAVALYLQALELQPNHIDARRALRDVEVRRCQERGVTKSTAGGWLKGIGSFLGAVLFGLLRKHDRAMASCETFLKNDPYNTTVLNMLSRAAEKGGLLDTAILALEEVRTRRGQPTKPRAIKSYNKVLKRLAELYIQAEKLPLADERLKEALNLDSKDRDALNRMRDVAAQRSMVEGGWDKAGDRGGYRQVLKDQQKSQDLEDQGRDVRTRDDAEAAIKRTLHDLEADPQNSRFMIQIGDLYKMMREWDQSRSWYNKALEVDPNNFLAQAYLGDLKLAEMDDRIRELRKDESKKAEAAAVRQERMAFALDEFQRRVQARPQDLPTRFRYGEVLYQMKRWKEASAQFQQSSRDPKTRRASLYRLGLCFMNQGLSDLAVEQLNKAVAGASLVDKEAKSILYALGVVHEQQGRVNEALDAYKRIFEVDINFKDVSAKIQNLYSRADGQAEAPGAAPES